MFKTDSILRLVALIAACASLVHGHIQMTTPYALNSTFNPQTPENFKDYSMTASLVKNGPYPCKGYIAPEMESVATWKAGQKVGVTLSGSAIHGGGSCQFSMSYDKGVTWNVILSYMGGCLEDSMTIQVPVPTESPSGEALFAWTWFNYMGKRRIFLLSS